MADHRFSMKGRHAKPSKQFQPAPIQYLFMGSLLKIQNNLLPYFTIQFYQKMLSTKSALQEYLDTKSRPSAAFPHNFAPAVGQPWETEFPNSKSECIDQLNRIKWNVKKQEEMITAQVKESQAAVLRQLDQEYQVLRKEICQQMDRVYEQNRLKVKIGFQSEGLGAINSLDVDLKQLQVRIDELLRELETRSTYKKSIAQTVLEDFQNKRRMISARTTEVLGQYQNYQFLTVDMNVFAQIKQNIGVLFVTQPQTKQVSFGDFMPGTFGKADSVFAETGNFKNLSQTELMRNDSPGINIFPTSNFDDFKPILNNAPKNALLSPPATQLKSGVSSPRAEPFSFQPSQASEHQRHIFELQSAKNQQLRESSAQQFRNSYSRQFQSQANFPSSVVHSRVEPLAKQKLRMQDIPYVNPHRNRDLIKRQS